MQIERSTILREYTFSQTMISRNGQSRGLSRADKPSSSMPKKTLGPIQPLLGLGPPIDADAAATADHLSVDGGLGSLQSNAEHKRMMLVRQLSSPGSTDLAKSLVDIDTDQVKLLREWYSKARAKHQEYEGKLSMALLSRNYNEKASRLYYALYTLMYSSITASKTDTLEKYVRTKGLAFPKTVFDIDEWKYPLRIAKESRTQELQMMRYELEMQKQGMQQRLVAMESIVRPCRADIAQARSTVESEMAQLRVMLTQAQHQIAHVVSEFAKKQQSLADTTRQIQGEVEVEKNKGQLMERQFEAAVTQVASITKEKAALQEELYKVIAARTAAIAESAGIIESLQRQLEGATKQLGVANGEKEKWKAAHIKQSDGITAKLNEHEKRESMLTKQVADLTAQLSTTLSPDAQKVIDDMSRELEDARARSATDARNTDALTKQVADLTAQLSTTLSPDAQKVIDDMSRELEDARARSATDATANVALRTDTDKLSADLQRALTAAETVEGEKRTLAGVVGRLESETESLRSQLAVVEQALANSAAEGVTKKAEATAVEEALRREVEDFRRASKADAAAAASNATSLQDELEAARISLRDAQNARSTTLGELDAAQAKLTELSKSLERSQQALRDQLAGSDAANAMQSLHQEQALQAVQFETQLQSLRSIIETEKEVSAQLRREDDAKAVELKVLKEQLLAASTDAEARSAALAADNIRLEQQLAAGAVATGATDDDAERQLQAATSQLRDSLTAIGKLKVAYEDSTKRVAELEATIATMQTEASTRDQEREKEKGEMDREREALEAAEELQKVKAAAAALEATNIKLQMNVNSLQLKLTGAELQLQRFLGVTQDPTADPAAAGGGASSSLSLIPTFSQLNAASAMPPRRLSSTGVALVTEIDDVSYPESVKEQNYNSGGEESTSQSKITEAQISGWKNACETLRAKLNKEQTERKKLQASVKEFKAMLHQALDGDFTSASLANQIVQRVTQRRLQTEDELIQLLHEYDELKVCEKVLHARIADFKVLLSAQTHGESFGLRKQLDVVKGNLAANEKKIIDLLDVQAAYLALKLEHVELQALFYEQSRQLLASAQEVMVLKQSKSTTLRAVLQVGRLREKDPVQDGGEARSDSPKLSSSPEQAAGGGPSGGSESAGGSRGRFPKIDDKSPRSSQEPEMDDDDPLKHLILVPGIGGHYKKEIVAAAKHKRMLDERRSKDLLLTIYAADSHSFELEAFSKKTPPADSKKRGAYLH